MYEQLSLFDLFEKKSDFPCDDCVFCEKGCCAHVQGPECYCVLGSFQVKRSQALCPRCGKKMEITQSDFGNDGANCRCGTRVIFKNRGNRPTAMELFRRGELYGV
jgi:DNA-directed RNA polymerase subunit RPC12/RpoP